MRNVELAGLQPLGFSIPGPLSPMLQSLADGGTVDTGLGLGILRHTTGHDQATITGNNRYLALRQTLDAVIDSLSK